MIPQENKIINRVHVSQIQADAEAYFRIADDMVRSSGELLPHEGWLVPFRAETPASGAQEGVVFTTSRDAYQRQFSRMENLMEAWIGSTTDELKAPNTITKYRRFLDGCDFLGLWEPNVTRRSPGSGPLLQADLGSIMDLNLLYAFTNPPQGRPTRILEVGGGYGRLAEAAFNVFGTSVQYVIVDAVPASLYYVREYLTRSCPDARIWSWYDSEDAKPAPDADIIIIPAWHFSTLSIDSYDVCVNIESMQEMTQYHVDHYLRLFQDITADGATIYLSNARGYLFKGTFNYPANWEKVFESLTPRSWALDHPTEIFRKTDGDFSRQNACADAAYRYGRWLHQDLDGVMDRNRFLDVLGPVSRRAVRAAKGRAKSLADRSRLS
jgi:hypothetical protein